MATIDYSEISAYWDDNVAVWPIAKHSAGTPEFFLETESYRFDKLDYLDKRVDYAGYAQCEVLEIGCGLGNDLSRFARGGAQCTGIDISPAAVELARANFEQRGLKGDFEVMNGEDMSFAENQFDVVYCHTVLQFTPDPMRVINEIHRVLKPGGVGYLMATNRRSWLYLMHLLFRIKIDHLSSPVYNRHSFRQFSEMLGAFEDVTILRERYPVATRIHSGAMAGLFNAVFVPVYERLVPLRLKQLFAHHFLAVCRKQTAGS